MVEFKSISKYPPENILRMGTGASYWENFVTNEVFSILIGPPLSECRNLPTAKGLL